jgi:putative membrane protein
MTHEALGNLLAPVNAFLNLASTVCLIAGYRYIKKRMTLHHRRAMLGAVAASLLFLVFYVLRYSLTGTHRFAGAGLARLAYLSLLFTHMLLAALTVPLVLGLLYLAWHSRFQTHARLARWTFPIWLYVSVSGLLVYLLLYHVYGYI